MVSVMSGSSVYEYSFILKQRHRGNVLFVIGFVLVMFALCSLMLGVVLFPVSLKSSSMQPTLHGGDAVFVTPLASPVLEEHEVPLVSSLLHCIDLERGDLVYVKGADEANVSGARKILDAALRFVTLQKVSAVTSNKFVSSAPCIRRVVGLPGDVVYMKDFVLYIRPRGETHFLTEFELSPKSYDIAIDTLPPLWLSDSAFSGNCEPHYIGKNEYFVLADNRTHAADSRQWGVVRGAQIGGKVLLRYWPFNRFALF